MEVGALRRAGVAVIGLLLLLAPTRAQAAVAFVQSAVTASATPFDVPGVADVTLAAPTTIGNQVVVLIALASSTRSVTSVTLGGGGTFAVCTDPGAAAATTEISGLETWAYCGIAASASTAVQVTMSTASTANGIVVVAEFSGQHATTPIEDVATGTTTPAALPHTTGAVTTTAAGSVMVGLIWGSTGTYTIDADFAAFTSATTAFTTSGYDLVDATTASFDVTTPQLETSVQLLVAIAPAAAAAGRAGRCLLVGVCE